MIAYMACRATIARGFDFSRISVHLAGHKHLYERMRFKMLGLYPILGIFPEHCHDINAVFDKTAGRLVCMR